MTISVYTGVRMPVYEELRDRWLQNRPPPTGARSAHLPVWASMCAGAVAGSFAQLLSSPMDLVKVRMQIQQRTGGIK
jgi:hypothetical protein